MNKLSDVLIENKKLKNREKDREQELQGLGMDFDVLVSYIKKFRYIVKQNPDIIIKDRITDLDWSYKDRYGNVAGLFKEEN